MKKMILLGAAAIMAFGASAQMSLVKDLAKKAASGNLMEMAMVLEQIEPAFTNPESANDVLTWFTAGKAAFGLYDELYKQKLMSQPVDDNMMSQALAAGYEFYQKALPLDTIVEMDKNGAPKLNKDGSKKVKTKYSKEMIDVMIGHLGDIANLGNIYWGKEDWANAANAYGYFADLGSSAFAAANNVAQPDSTIAEVRCFQGFALFNTKDYAAAFDAFSKAIALGYTANNISVYHGAALGNIVEALVKDNKYNEANVKVDNAIKMYPDNSTFYDLKGYIVENEKGNEDAFGYYEKAAQLGPDHADAQYYYGRALAIKADGIINAKENENATTAELLPKIKPVYEQALVYLNKAVQLNPAMNEAQGLIDKIKYLLYGE